MASILKWARESIQRSPSPPMRFPTSGFKTIDASEVLEEEQFEDFKTGRYYPVNIGEIFSSKYQVVGKLGFGVTSSVWLARDLKQHRHVSLKVYKRQEANWEEFEVYKRLNQGNSSHPGYGHVRTALGVFTIPRAGGDHYCLVQKPTWESFRDLLHRNPRHRFTEELLKTGLMQVFLALDYLHTECQLVHTDIKGDNILQEIEDTSILDAFANAEIDNPSPRKFINDAPVYASRRLELPRKFGKAVLSDFGSAVRGDEKRNHDAQPNVYRSPEVMLKTKWSYPVDVWNVGVMGCHLFSPLYCSSESLTNAHQIWDLFEGKHMFHGNDPDGKGYSTRAHVAEVIGMLGPPPMDLLRRGIRSHEFFTEGGTWKADVKSPQDTSLERSEEFLEGKNKDMFLVFMRGMLQWRPEDRKTAKELLEDPWLNNQID